MNRTGNSLVSLLNLNGGINKGPIIRERYNLSSVLEDREGMKGELLDLLSIGDLFIEKLRRLRALNGKPGKLGISPYVEKIFRKHDTGHILDRYEE